MQAFMTANKFPTGPVILVNHIKDALHFTGLYLIKTLLLSCLHSLTEAPTIEVMSY